MKKTTWLLSTSVLMFACGQQTNKTNSDSTNSAKGKPDSTTIASTTKDIAHPNVDEKLTSFSKFIAGMEHGVKNKHSESQAWKGHVAAVNSEWADLARRIETPIKNWVDTAKLSIAGESNTLFYPFAGGDFFYANLFYPNQDTTIMIGLEPCGSVFDPDKKENLGSYYTKIRQTLFFPHKYGFYRTLSMEVDFKHPEQNGTLHPNLLYLAKAGYEIYYIEHFNIDAKGNVIEVTQAADNKNAGHFHGYRIGYAKPGSKEVKQLVYFSIDASDQGLKGLYAGYFKWIKSHRKVVSFFKAASYLMHHPGSFGMMREYVNQASERILQDDSGMPFKYLKDNQWNVKCLGTYTGTISLFAAQYQPDLRKEYEKQKSKKLPFMIGYNVSLGTCNLQYAVKSK